MKKSAHAVCRANVFFVLLIAGTSLSSLAAEPKEKIIVDFASSRHDRDGTVFRPYEYAFGTWNKHVSDLAGRGTLIKAPDGKGGLGENRSAAEIHKAPGVVLQLIVGNGNKAVALNFSLEDKDGTESTWRIPLEGKPVGQLLGFKLMLSSPDSEAKPGKVPGLSIKKSMTWQVKGDWTGPNVEVLLVKLIAAP